MSMLDDSSIVDGPALLTMAQDDPRVFKLLKAINKAVAAPPGTPGTLRVRGLDKTGEPVGVLASTDVPPLGVSAATKLPWPKASATYIEDVLNGLRNNKRFRDIHEPIVASNIIGLDDVASDYRLKPIQMHPQCPFLLYCRGFGFFWTPTFVQFIRAGLDRELPHAYRLQIYKAFRLRRKFHPVLSTFYQFQDSLMDPWPRRKNIALPHPTVIDKLVRVLPHWVYYYGLHDQPWRDIADEWNDLVWPTIPASVKAEGETYSKETVGSVESFLDVQRLFP